MLVTDVILWQLLIISVIKILESKDSSRMFQLCSPILSPVSFQLSDELSETTRGRDDLKYWFLVIL